MSYLDNVRVFVRVVELGTLSAAGRDQRVTPAVASNRIKELERHMGVRLFNRTTRKLTPTEHGRVFYDGAVKILEAVNEAENAIADLSRNPKGALKITAPLGIGRRLIASGIPEFHDKYPDIEVRLRLSDHNVDILSEGVDVAFKLGILEDSNLRMRGIMNCERVVCGAPAYFEKRGIPQTRQQHALGIKRFTLPCPLFRYPLRQRANTKTQKVAPRRMHRLCIQQHRIKAVFLAHCYRFVKTFYAQPVISALFVVVSEAVGGALSRACAASSALYRL